VTAIKKEFDDAKVDYKFVAYEGAKHSFTNPDADSNGAKFNLPLAYNKEADEKSWQELDQFLQKIF
ncbi:MAG: dienelactone hydrolase family protein, partial [Calditrichaeota bacterium]|nr:dienelactone hydrolase family protein [Calditrichota bacterium]